MSTITEAASVLLTRGPGSEEVFAVRRSESLRFFGGFIAFPGGKVDVADSRFLPLTADPEDVRRVSAVREVFEETGILLARLPDGSFPSSGPELTQARRDVVTERLAFGDLLARMRLQVRFDDLTALGHLVTPPFTTMRYDTAFFVAEAPPGQVAEVWPGELDAGRWASARELLDEWVRGETLLSPPTVALLELVRDRPIAELADRVRPLIESHSDRTVPPIWFAPAVRMIPLRTLPLPPSTHTNAFLVGTGRRYLIDPGPKDADEQARLFTVLDEGPRPDAIILSHHHPDHIGATNACVGRYPLPVWAHPETAARLQGRIAVDRLLHDGERIDLGVAPDGNPGWHLIAIHTPGHAPGHLAFYEPRYRLLFAGDMVSTLSSIVIAPPDGDLAVYLDSLRKLQGYDTRLLLPSHGSASSRPQHTLAEAIEHRVKREKQLLAALGREPRRIPDLVTELYKGLPSALTRLAELQMLAGLQKLDREGRVEAVGEMGWRLK